MYVARETTGRSLPFIGKKIGGRDHTTVLHGVNVVKGLIEAGDAETIAAVDQIVEQLHTQVFKLPVVCPQVSEPHPPAPPPPPPAPEATAPMLVLQELTVAQESPPAPARITVCRVLEVTADHFGTPLDDLVSRRRTQPLVRRRQVAMYVARQMTGRSLPFIAHDMGKRHHTTVSDGVRVVKDLLEAGDAETIAAVDQIIERLQVTGGAHD
jgi:chromosomal replication initiation ATPase DnaA